MEQATCPYPGSRFHHPRKMNVSALKQMGAHWPSALEVLRGFWSQYLAYAGVEKITSYWELWRLTQLGTSWPAYSVLRARDPVPESQLPVETAVAFKLVVGLAPAALRLGVDELLGKTSSVSVDEVFTRCEQDLLFVGSAEVCAGPEALIREVVGLLLDGEGRPASLVEPRTRYAMTVANLSIASYVRLIWQSAALHDFVRAVTPDERPALQAAFRPAFESVCRDLLSLVTFELPPPERAKTFAPMAQLLIDDADWLRRFPLRGSAEALVGAWADPADSAALAERLGAEGRPAPRALAELIARVSQIEQRFLRLCLPLCNRARDALGVEAPAPLDELDQRLIGRLPAFDQLGPKIRTALEAVAPATWQIGLERWSYQ